MKRYQYLSILAISVLFLASCAKETPIVPGGGTYYPIFNGYMLFSTDVSSRATLATDMHNKSFGVLGYQYSPTTNWDTAKALATPNLFYNQEVSCNEKGVCSYEPIKPWEDYKYSFFAYHPYATADNGITISGKDVVGSPTLTYTYPWIGTVVDDGESVPVVNYDKDQICDLMTAEAIDEDGSSNVNLDFKHRFFAVEVLATNYNETGYQLDKDGNQIWVDATQKINNLILIVKGLTYKSMTIPMSTLSGEPEYISREKIAWGNKTNEVRFELSKREVIVPAFNEGGNGYATSISKLGSSNSNGYLMLIPQSEDLEFTVNWFGNNNVTHNPTAVKSTMSFEPGKLYQVIINFVGSGITIALIEAGSWQIEDVYHTFE